MDIDSIYESYIKSDRYQSSPEIDNAIEEMMHALRSGNLAPDHMEERIHEILDTQEAMAFEAGFCEAFEFCFNITTLIDKYRK